MTALALIIKQVLLPHFGKFLHTALRHAAPDLVIGRALLKRVLQDLSVRRSRNMAFCCVADVFLLEKFRLQALSASKSILRKGFETNSIRRKGKKRIPLQSGIGKISP